MLKVLPVSKDTKVPMVKLDQMEHKVPQVLLVLMVVQALMVPKVLLAR